MILTDTRELRRIFDLAPDDSSEDLKLSLYAEWATGVIEEYLGRPGLTLAARTEYYQGTNTRKLNLKSRPVFASPAITVYEDLSGLFGQSSGGFPSDTQLTFGTDFGLQIDQPDGSSRSGILVKVSGVWRRPIVRQRGFLSAYVGDGAGTIKVSYTGGYTVDTLPANFRTAANLLVARMRYLFPLGMPITSESYEERHISLFQRDRDYLLSMVKPLLWTYRNHKW